MLSRETEILALPPCLARHPRLEHGPTAGESPVVAPGEVAEWSNAPHSKCGIGASLSGVRIPPSPPYRPKSSDFSALPEVGYLTAHIPAHTCDRTANELLGHEDAPQTLDWRLERCPNVVCDFGRTRSVRCRAAISSRSRTTATLLLRGDRGKRQSDISCSNDVGLSRKLRPGRDTHGRFGAIACQGSAAAGYAIAIIGR